MATQNQNQTFLPDWLVHVLASLNRQIPCILITVVQTQGSVPREPGTRMVVMADQTQLGTIGGGTLEYQAIRYAQTLWATAPTTPLSHLQRFTLGPDLGQCCGGVVTLHFERLSVQHSPWPEQLASLLMIGETGMLHSRPAEHAHPSLTGRTLITPYPLTDNLLDIQLTPPMTGIAGDEPYMLQERIFPHDFHIALYGAGHVGQALVTVLAGLPCRVHWVDNRQQQFPPELPTNVTRYLVEEPATSVSTMPADSYHLVMTHDHALDLELCDHILAREDVRFLGLIGSATKAARFRHRLLQRGIPPQQLERLTCPIGIAGIQDKHPAAIAIAIAAQLLLERSKPVSPLYRREHTHEHTHTAT